MKETIGPSADTVPAEARTDRMTVRDVAAHLRCSEYKARRLLGGDIPAYFDGRRWTASRADVLAFVAANSQTGKHRRAKGRRGRGKSLGAQR